MINGCVFFNIIYSQYCDGRYIKMQIINNKVEMFMILERTKNVYCYGYGGLGNALYFYLKENNYEKKINGFIDQRAFYLKHDYDVEPKMNIISLDQLSITDVSIIITVTEMYYDEIITQLRNRAINNIYVLGKEFAYMLLNDIKKNIQVKPKSSEKLVSGCLNYMILNILDHCNLNCKGCTHFSCIAENYFVSYQSIYNDLKRMSELLNSNCLMRMGIMGGEPLLHPNLLKILVIARNFFPQTIIELDTNGLLLLKQNREFWKTCKENNIKIVLTRYPIDLNYDQILDKADCEKVNLKFYRGTSGNVQKTLYKHIIDLNGNMNPTKSFENCMESKCHFLMEGKFYICHFMCESYRVFNRKFKENLELKDNDFLDIYQIKDKNELVAYINEAKPYCRYCAGYETNLKWETTQMKKEEWT